MYCDMQDCKGGKHVYSRFCGHDVCSLCLIEVKKEGEKEYHSACPECYEKSITG